MQLHNLKHNEQKVSFSEAVKLGIGKDQGLFFPPQIEPLSQVDELLDLDFVSRSQKILRHLIGDEIADLEEIVADAFSFPLKLQQAKNNIYALELFHGPTLAFKDFGARFLARVLKAVKDDGHLTILTATSGDTGAAVADAFYKQDGIDVVVLFPKGKISKLQQKMIDTLGSNIRAVEINGTFDMCQDLVKTAFLDEPFRQAVGLNSANSINIARLLAQVCYYFEAIAQLDKAKRDDVVFCVPCGNFGNICAGLIAKALGLKCNFIVATNANDTVPRYLHTGKWEPKDTIACMSNAMDISRPNNWPRVEALFKMQGWDLSSLKYGSVSDDITAKTMQELKDDYILEPHAAVAYRVLKDNLQEGQTGIFLGTAHSAKFKGDVDRILDIDLPLPKAIADKINLPSLSVTLNNDYDALKAYMTKELLK